MHKGAEDVLLGEFNDFVNLVKEELRFISNTKSIALSYVDGHVTTDFDALLGRRWCLLSAGASVGGFSMLVVHSIFHASSMVAAVFACVSRGVDIVGGRKARRGRETRCAGSSGSDEWLT